MQRSVAIMLASLITNTAHAQHHAAPDPRVVRSYDKNGELICERPYEQFGEQPSRGTCAAAPGAVVTIIHNPLVVDVSNERMTESERTLAIERIRNVNERLAALEHAFVTEAVRQRRAAHHIIEHAPKPYIAPVERTDWWGIVDTSNSNRLQEIVAERERLLGALFSWGMRFAEGVVSTGEYEDRWTMQRGTLDTYMPTPIQEERFGPYSARTQRALDDLTQRFVSECIRQRVSGNIELGTQLLEITLWASYRMFTATAPQDRAALYHAWDEHCHTEGEDPIIASVRFLLSKDVRDAWHVSRHQSTYAVGFEEDGKNGAWTCNTFNVHHVTACGNVEFWHSEEGERPDVTSSFRDSIQTLPEALRTDG
ncbi:MAG: hypothetical protein Q7S96_04675 [bacterium]|nr:hypothetical protein [bacterium]